MILVLLIRTKSWLDISTNLMTPLFNPEAWYDNIYWMFCTDTKTSEIRWQDFRKHSGIFIMQYWYSVPVKLKHFVQNNKHLLHICLFHSLCLLQTIICAFTNNFMCLYKLFSLLNIFLWTITDLFLLRQNSYLDFLLKIKFWWRLNIHNLFQLEVMCGSIGTRHQDLVRCGWIPPTDLSSTGQGNQVSPLICLWLFLYIPLYAKTKIN